jgi:hypothetical protein
MEHINPIASSTVETAQDTNTNGVPGSLPGETRTETQARLFKVTVDGQDMEVDEDELRRGYQHAKAASKRFEEAAMTRKEAETVIRMFKENPREAFKALGQDARKFAESVIQDELSEAMLSPEQKELRDYKRKVEKYESESRLAKETYDKEQMESEIARQSEAIQTQIIDTLGTAGLPKTERTVSRMVYYMQSALAAGYNVAPADVVDQVKKDYQYDMQSLLGGLTEDQIEMFLGNDLYRKIAKSTVKAAKPAIVPKAVNSTVKREAKPTKKIMSPRDFFNQS